MKSVFAKSLAIVLSASIALPPAASAQMDDGTFYYRYKFMVAANDDSGEYAKDITAYFVAGVGLDFAELLPLKGKWERDTWTVVSGTLPEGISFDPVTRKFSGRASKTGKSVVNLIAYDQAGERVGSAEANFEVFDLQTQPAEVLIYAHTNKFRSYALPLPSGVEVATWQRLTPMPTGFSQNGRLIEGTATAEGTYPLLIRGLDYTGKEVVSFIGRYVVEDGPTFRTIADIVKPIPSQTSLQFSFGSAMPAHKVNYGIDGDARVEYTYEVKQGETLPFTSVMKKWGTPPVAMDFNTVTPYQTALIRYKAVDVDGTVGYSNWFRYGSSNPTPNCSYQSGSTLSFFTGIDPKLPVPVPSGAYGDLSFELVSGELPEGTSLDAKTGLISGVPVKVEPTRALEFRVSVANGENVETTSCFFSVEVKPKMPSVRDTLAGLQGQHVRVGHEYAGAIEIADAIPDYTVSFADPSVPVTLTGDALNPKRLDVSGVVPDIGLPHKWTVRVANGDGETHDVAPVVVFAHPDLSVGPLAGVSFKRRDDLFGVSIPYDADSVIPDVTGTVSYPVMAMAEGSPALPDGIVLDSAQRRFAGSAAAAAGTYGPYRVTMTDASGETATSAPFSIEVTARDAIELNVVGDADFYAGAAAPQTKSPIAIKQPGGAAKLRQTWSIVGTVPSWLTVDADTGALTARTGALSLPDVKSYGKFRLSVVDEDGETATSDEFEVRVLDKPLPTITAFQGQILSNVTGDAQAGEAAVYFAGPKLSDYIDANTIYGAKSDVTFSPESSLPEGLSIDPKTGVISGEPKAEYAGPVRIVITDVEGRSGVVLIAADIRPYPRLDIASSQSIPRYASGIDNIAPILPNKGFRGVPSAFALAGNSAPLPSGLTVDPATGRIVGKVTAPEGVYSGIVVAAVDRGGSNLIGTTRPITIIVGQRVAMELETADKPTFFFVEEESGARSYLNSNAAAAGLKVTGSSADPVTFAIVDVTPAAPWLGVNATTGILTGTPPAVGKWTVTARATDADGVSATFQFEVLATLTEKVKIRGNADVNRVLRSKESFSTTALDTWNRVGSMVFALSPASYPQTLDFDPATGSLRRFSSIENSAVTTRYTLSVSGKDEHDRGLERNPQFSFEVVPPLAIDMEHLNPVNFDAVQYDPAKPFRFAMKQPRNVIGEITYDVVGTVPGTLVRKTHVPGVVYRWTENGAARQTTDVSALPLDAIVVDQQYGLVEGVASSSGSFALAAKATDGHASAYEETGDATRLAYNTAVSEQVTLAVKPAEEFAFATANPRVFVASRAYNELIATKTQAYGVAPTVTVNGTPALPPGLSYAVEPGGIRITGTPTLTGTFGGIAVTARDAAGRVINPTIAMRVIEPTDMILLDVANVKTKVGKPFWMVPTSSNTYGDVEYHTDIVDPAIKDKVSVDPATGRVALRSNFTAPGKVTFNLSVSDETRRLTSKPVTVEVLPNLSIQVPAVINVAQGQTLNTLPDVSFVAGTVTFEKDGTQWPAGADLDTTTGRINGKVTAVAGDYPGLKVKGTDSFFGVTDVASSNAFTLKVTPYVGNPYFDAVPNFMVSDQTPVSTAPVVRDAQDASVWKYGGLTFTLNKPLPAGLTLDPATGKISGTSNDPGIYTGYTYLVTTAGGKTATSGAFTVTVPPSGPLTLDPTTVLDYDARVGVQMVTETPKFLNTFGPMTFTRVTPAAPGWSEQPKGHYQSIFAGYTTLLGDGRISGTYPDWIAVGPAYFMTVKATDQFGRSVEFTYNVNVGSVPTVAYSSALLEINSAVSVTPTATNVPQSGVFSISPALPAGLDIDASTGIISGSASTPISTSFVVTLTDKFGSVRSQPFTLTFYDPNAEEVWRVVIDQWYVHHSFPACVGWAEMVALSGGVNVTAASAISVFDADAAYPAGNLTDGNPFTQWYGIQDITPKSIEIVVPAGKPLTHIRFTPRQDGYPHCVPSQMTIERSFDNKATWSKQKTVTNNPVLGQNLEVDVYGY
ncbi:putative Ig domain-containing protein [Rhizobium flavescens]|uniref:putative Ig domain-containing protein n=1 Tax=Rhizobium flavescens TaxID=2607407 RepID=UPI001408CCB3|nr:putative Ig domain-containing protein [Rhizobium flavescens]